MSVTISVKKLFVIEKTHYGLMDSQMKESELRDKLKKAGFEKTSTLLKDDFIEVFENPSLRDDSKRTLVFIEGGNIARQVFNIAKPLA